MAEACEEKNLQERETDSCRDEEAQEVGECAVGDAVCGPWAVVVHLGDASICVRWMLRSITLK
jgi:hypothetical protein